MRSDVGRVEQDEQCVRRGFFLVLAGDRFEGDALVERAGGEAVNAGQVDQFDIAAGFGFEIAAPAFDGDAA